MPRTEAANQRLREAQREKILDAARRVFARKGMEATMGEIATEATVSHGLAYHYFVSKEAILHELIEQMMQSGPARWQHVLEMLSGTPGERLALLVSRLMEARREHPEIYQLLDQVQRSETTPADLLELIQQQSKTFDDMMRQLIVEGQETFEVAAGDPDQLVRAIFACLEGLTRWATYDPEHYHDHFPDAGIFLRMLKP